MCHDIRYGVGRGSLVEAALSMLVDVETLFLDTLVHSQTGNLLDGEEQYRSRHSSPGVDGQDAETLCSEETETAYVESTAVYSQQTGHQSAENAAYAMYGTGADGVVYVELGVDELDGEHEDDACQQTDDGGAQWRH